LLLYSEQIKEKNLLVKIYLS